MLFRPQTFIYYLIDEAQKFVILGNYELLRFYSSIEILSCYSSIFDDFDKINCESEEKKC